MVGYIGVEEMEVSVLKTSNASIIESKTMSTRIPLIFVSPLMVAEYFNAWLIVSGQGGAAFGAPNTNTTRIHTIPEAQKVVDLFMSHGQNGFDTSRAYGFGTSEEVCPHVCVN